MRADQGWQNRADPRGCGGSTGHIAVQVAAALGGRVATRVSSEVKTELGLKLGDERVIAYRREDFVAAAHEWSVGRGIDVALDNLGLEISRKTIAAMAPYGRLFTLMGMPGDDADETAYLQNLTVHNVMMLTPMLLGMQARLDHQATIVARGFQMLANGEIQMVIDSRFDLDDIAAAHKQLDSGSNTGKIVIDIAG